MSDHEVQVRAERVEQVVVRTGVREFVPDGALAQDDPRYADALRDSNLRNLALRNQLEGIEVEVSIFLGKLRIFLCSHAITTTEGEVVIRYRDSDLDADKMGDTVLPRSVEDVERAIDAARRGG